MTRHIVWITGIFLLLCPGTFAQKVQKSRAYFISLSGNDQNDGGRSHPWQTIQRLNTQHLRPGDSLFFAAGQTFKGTLLIQAAMGTTGQPILVGSYGRGGDATIDGGDSSAVLLYQTAYLTIANLHLAGAGRKTGNLKEGLSLLGCRHITARKLDITGFQKAGLMIYASTDITVSHIFAHENGSAGIAVEGDFSGKKTSGNIRILDCRAEDNPGDPTNLTNHSGNGIVAGHCTGLLIDRCTATNNGWDMPRIGNGPVGIWCYEADSVLIQHCLAYRNKTSPGAADGGGFDLDGGVTNSVIQYCFSYGNQGSGYCIFQYWGASPWYHNIIRYNISEDDGTVSDSQAGLYIWNSSDDEKQFYDCRVYGNIVYNKRVAAISFSEKSENKGFRFSNNVFVGKDSLIKGKDKIGQCLFQYNDWWSIDKGFNIDGIRDLKTWSLKTGQEQKDGMVVGLNINPDFKDPGKATLTGASQLSTLTGYELPVNSPLRHQPVFTNIHGIRGLEQGIKRLKKE
jgi:hypothetical protein